MYIPPHFLEENPQAVAGLIDRFPLACIVASTAGGLIANHIPLLASRDRKLLIGHVALANDIHREIEPGQEVLAIFRADDAYISPNSYPGKAEHHRHVPTWNYEVVHVYGTISFQHEESAKRAAVGLLTRKQELELHGSKAWRMADAPRDFLDRSLANIVGLRIEPTRILAKSKMSQNREERDRLGAAEDLRARGKTEMADRMTGRSSGLG